MNHRSHRFVGYLTKTPVRKKKCEVLAVLTLVVLFLAPALAQDDELNEVIPRSKTSDEKQTAKLFSQYTFALFQSSIMKRRCNLMLTGGLYLRVGKQPSDDSRKYNKDCPRFINFLLSLLAFIG